MFPESVSEDGQLTIGLEATEGFLGLQIPAAVHRSAISALRQRLTLRLPVHHQSTKTAVDSRYIIFLPIRGCFGRSFWT